MNEPSAIDLLRRHHEFADDYGNFVSTNEHYWSDNGEIITRARKWYWQSELREQTIAALEAQERE